VPMTTIAIPEIRVMTDAVRRLPAAFPRIT
jgi:hypothetical protein